MLLDLQKYFPTASIKFVSVHLFEITEERGAKRREKKKSVSGVLSNRAFERFKHLFIGELWRYFGEQTSGAEPGYSPPPKTVNPFSHQVNPQSLVLFLLMLFLENFIGLNISVPK